MKGHSHSVDSVSSESAVTRSRQAPDREGPAAEHERSAGPGLSGVLRNAGSPLVQRKCASCGGGRAGLGGNCASCDKEERFGGAGVQPKLTVNAPGDRYEEEADRVADQVMAGSSGQMASPRISPLIQRQEAGEEEEEELQTKSLQRQEGPEEEEEALQSKDLQRQEVEEEEELQAKAGADSASARSAAGSASGAGRGRSGRPGASSLSQSASRPSFVSGLQAEAAGGSSLTSELRSFFEPRFGRDLSQVRIHAGGRAGGLSREINARAFTHANHIYFGAGQYDPDSSQGRRLLAHELTHTVQQGAVDSPSPQLQREALSSPVRMVPIPMDTPANPNQAPEGELVKIHISARKAKSQSLGKSLSGGDQ